MNEEPEDSRPRGVVIQSDDLKMFDPLASPVINKTKKIVFVPITPNSRKIEISIEPLDGDVTANHDNCSPPQQTEEECKGRFHIRRAAHDENIEANNLSPINTDLKTYSPKRRLSADSPSRVLCLTNQSSPSEISPKKPRRFTINVEVTKSSNENDDDDLLIFTPKKQSPQHNPNFPSQILDF